jgi:hypothetical protein
MRKSRSSASLSVIADGAYPEELAPAVRDLPAARPVAKERPKRERKPSYGRDLPTIIAPRPRLSSFPRRRAFRVVGIVAAAIAVALLVLIGTEGARLMHPNPHVAAQRVAFSPLPEQAPIAPPPAVAAEPSATPIPIMKPSELPTVKRAKKRR